MAIMEYQSTQIKPIKTFNLSGLMPPIEVNNSYMFIKGELVLEGRQPDGDSVAFIPNNIEDFNGVYRSFLLQPSDRDGSIQLRFEGIDTPELHYGGTGVATFDQTIS